MLRLLLYIATLFTLHMIVRGLLRSFACCIAGAGFALLAELLLGTAPAHAERRVALVVGNNRYSNLGADRQLLKAVNDAPRLSAMRWRKSDSASSAAPISAGKG